MQTLIVLVNESDEKISGHVLLLAWHEKDIQKGGGGGAGRHDDIFHFLNFCHLHEFAYAFAHRRKHLRYELTRAS